MTVRTLKINLDELKKSMPTIPTNTNTPMDIHEHFPFSSDYQAHEIYRRTVMSPLLNEGDDSLPSDFTQFHVSGVLHLACPRKGGKSVCHQNKDNTYGPEEDKEVKDFIMSLANPSQISFAISDKGFIGTEHRKKGHFGLTIGDIRTYFSLENQVFINEIEKSKYCKTLSVPFTLVCRFNNLTHWNGNNAFRDDAVFRSQVMIQIVNSIRWTSPIITSFANMYPVSVHCWENCSKDNKFYAKDILTEVVDEIEIMNNPDKNFKAEYKKTNDTLKARWQLATHVSVQMIPSGEKKKPLK